MIKLAYYVNFSSSKIEGYDIVIVAIPEKDQYNKEIIELKLQEILANRYNVKLEKMKINNFWIKNLNKIKLSDITIQDFALLFDLDKHLK